MLPQSVGVSNERFGGSKHPDVTNVATWNEALAGKFLIPQPFGKLNSLYECGSGFCISRYMILELAVAIILEVGASENAVEKPDVIAWKDRGIGLWVFHFV